MASIDSLQRTAGPTHTTTGPPPPAPARRSSGPRIILIAVLGVVAVGAVAFATVALFASGASVGADPEALASVALPPVGGTIQSVTATGPDGRAVPLVVRGGRVWPRALLPVNTPISVTAVLRRPGWVGWLAGSTQRVHVTLRTPAATLRQTLLTLDPRAALRVSFDKPIRVIVSGEPGSLRRRVFPKPAAVVAIHRNGQAGTTTVTAVPRAWELLPAPTVVSWFPTGSTGSALASPRPGTKLPPQSALVLTFSETVGSALHGARPHLIPAVPGHWKVTGSHTLTFHPEGYGYPLGGTVSLELPGSTALIGAKGARAQWKVPTGTTLREQQLLSQLGYLPFRFVPRVPTAHHGPAFQAAAAVAPPAGRFRWRYANVPSALRAQWHPGKPNALSRGALMAFENDHGMNPDGLAGPAVWQAMMRDASHGKHTSFGFSFVSVSLSGQSLVLWHNGHTILTTPVNTGIPGRATDPGVFNVYSHLQSTTMTGTNPDGSHYSDPGVPWVSYFNGGDALHGFPRASYGSPQSLGCVEIPIPTAGKIWPYTPVGTIVDVS